MKLLTFCILILLCFSCKKKIKSDISLSKLVDVIYWSDPEYLETDVSNAIELDLGIANIDQVTLVYNYNSDSTGVEILLNPIKSEINDINKNNNTLCVELVRTSDVLNDFSMKNFTTSQKCSLLTPLLNELPNYSFNDAEIVCIPLAFHILDYSPQIVNFYSTPNPLNSYYNTAPSSFDIERVLENLNENFIDSKIQFTLHSINSLSLSKTIININLDDEYPSEGLNSIDNVLNIYAPRFILADLYDPTYKGYAPFPVYHGDNSNVFIKQSYLGLRDNHSYVLSHEIGHYLSLFHTHETELDYIDCTEISNNTLNYGDGISDTPFNDDNGIIDCFGDNQIIKRNFMSYASVMFTGYCDRSFTNEQNKRMRFAYEKWRKDYLTIDCEGNNVTPSYNINVVGELNFGDQIINTTSDPKYIIITNNESVSIEVDFDFNYSNYSLSPASNDFTIDAYETKSFEVLFSPTSLTPYGGVVSINYGLNQVVTLPVSGTGVSGTSSSVNITYHSQVIDDSSGDNNGMVNAGESIELFVDLKNFGSSIATNVVGELSCTNSDISISNANSSYPNIGSSIQETNINSFAFSVASSSLAQTVTLNMDISSDQGTFSTTFPVIIESSNSSGNIIIPSNSCADAPVMNVNTEYSVIINTGDYGYSIPIDNESFEGNDVKGFWLGFEVPETWSADHDVKIYDVSSNFNPVFGIKANCSGPYLAHGTIFNPATYAINNNYLGGNETSDTNLPGNLGSDNLYWIRVYHYNGNEDLNISFKIIVE